MDEVSQLVNLVFIFREHVHRDDWTIEAGSYGPCGTTYTIKGRIRILFRRIKLRFLPALHLVSVRKKATQRLQIATVSQMRAKNTTVHAVRSLRLHPSKEFLLSYVKLTSGKSGRLAKLTRLLLCYL